MTHDMPITRRRFLTWSHAGIGSVALGSLLRSDSAASGPGGLDGLDGSLHHTPRARRVIQIVLCGGLSHIDSFDHKPALAKHHGQTLTTTEKPDVFFGKVGLLRASDWKFARHGHSGQWISELFPHLAEMADELLVVNSMFAETSNHTPATFQENTGFRLNGFPVMGAWLSYGLGNLTENLPTFVVIPDVRGVPAGGSINWSNGFLPAEHQGVVVRSRGTPIDDLFPARAMGAGRRDADRLLLEELNRRHADSRESLDELQSRIRAYEMTGRMQLAVPEVADLDAESADTHRLYGVDDERTVDFARSCLLARRMLERGVRFVQLFSGGAFGSPRINWDGHEDMVRNHSREALRIDRPIAGLLADLRRRGLLDDTLVMFTTEFGRTPFTQSGSDVLGTGRDHSQYGFSCWLAGAGLRRGISYGATDELGLRAAEAPVHWHDLHATVLHLLGLDHHRLTYYHNGIERRLTDVAGHVLEGLW